MKRHIAHLAYLASLAGCGHSDAFTGGTPAAQDGPLTVAAPTRLTYNDGMDHVASFSPDGTTLLYSFQSRFLLPPAVTSRPDVDRCIGLIPAGGGTRRERCRLDPPGRDSTDAFEHATVNGEGALLYGSYASASRALLANGGALRLGSLEAPWPGRVLLTTPTVVAGLSFDHFGVIRWATPSVFYVQVHDQTLIGNPYNEIKFDTLALGIGILRGELTGSGAVFSSVAGTDSATGFDFSPARDSLYFTRLDDAALYAVAIGGGARSVLYALPAASVRQILRDPVRVGARVAVVRQNYQPRLTQLNPPTGLESGAAVLLIRTAEATATVLATAPGSPLSQGSLAAFGALAATPDGCRLVVEHRLVQSFSFTTDLYSYCLGLTGSCGCG